MSHVRGTVFRVLANDIICSFFCSFAGMVYLHQRDIIHRDLKSSNGKKVVFELIIM